ncbi:hypothetical protein N9R98_00905 [bacterium]|nr:hypothetical protein [bacterium]
MPTTRMSIWLLRSGLIKGLVSRVRRQASARGPEGKRGSGMPLMLGYLGQDQG